MKFEIEQYKRQTIEYDDEIDKFICDITSNDTHKSVKRQSLKDVRNEINTFIKLNLEFKPFQVLHKYSYSTSFEVKLVAGIRTDGLFTVTSGTCIKENVDFLLDDNEYFDYDSELISDQEAIDREEEKYDTIIKEKRTALLKRLKLLDKNSWKPFADAFAKS